MQLTRHSLAAALQAALEPLDFVHAMWEGGSAAFGRADEYSDLDVQLDVDDARIADAFVAAEAALAALSPIELQYNLPEPAWHGMSQRFYKLRDAAPHLLVDLVIRRSSNREGFNEVEIHGEPIVYFDKGGVVVTKHLDPAQLNAQVRSRLAELAVVFPLFRGFVRKELARGNDLGALHFYQSLTLRPLHELARMLHCPARHSFSPHYAKFDLPAELVAQLTELSYVSSPAELVQKQDACAALFAQLVEELERLDAAS